MASIASFALNLGNRVPSPKGVTLGDGRSAVGGNPDGSDVVKRGVCCTTIHRKIVGHLCGYCNFCAGQADVELTQSAQRRQAP